MLARTRPRSVTIGPAPIGLPGPPAEIARLVGTIEARAPIQPARISH